MRSLSRKSWAIIAIVVGVLCTLTGAIFETCMQNTALSPQQIDPNFDASVVNPAFSNSHPIVLVDQAHNNFHTIEGSYKPFADLLRNDGYAVLPNDKEFSPSSLENASVLVIVNALGSWGGPAFSEAECNAVAQWVSSG